MTFDARLIRTLFAAIALFALAAFACGFFGAFVPFFDTLAQFRAHLAVVLVVSGIALIATSRRRGSILTGSIAIVFGLAGLALVAPYYLPSESIPQVRVGDAARSEPLPRYTLLQMNLRWDAKDKAEAIRRIGQLSPDVITMQEAQRGWKPMLETLSTAYPFRFGCPNRDDFTDALILSRRPFATGDEGRCSADGRFAARGVDFNGIVVEIAAQHLRWPWPGSQWRQIRSMEPQLEWMRSLARPVLLAGDFNAAPWTASLRRYADLAGLAIVDGIGPSWFFTPFTRWIAPYAGLPIDNVLHSGAIEIDGVVRKAATDSDHLPLLVTFSLLPAANAPKEPSMTVAGTR